MSAINILRDALFGNPPSPDFKPSREGVLSAFQQMQLQIDSLMVGVDSYALVADLPAGAANGSQARVYADPTPANNTYWIKVAGVWQIDTDLITAFGVIIQPFVDDAVAARDAAIEARDDAIDAASELESIWHIVSRPSVVVGAPSPATGTGTSGAATYVFAAPLTEDGFISRVVLFAMATGTVKVRRFTKAGDTFTAVPGQTDIVLTVAATGLNTFDIPYSSPVLAGELLGFYHSAAVVAYTGGASVSGGWYNGAGDVTTSFVDASVVSGSPLQISIQVRTILDLQGSFDDLQDQIDATNQNLDAKLDYNPPLRPALFVNAIRHRYGPTTETGVPFVGATSVSNQWSDDLWDEYREPNALRITQTAAGALAYTPEVSLFISPAQLATIGIVPDDTTPPVISLRAAILLAGLVNQNIDGTSGSVFGQVWVSLRYDGAAGSTSPNFTAGRQDCVMVNNTVGLLPSTYIPSPNPWAAKGGARLADTVNLKGYKFENIPVPATINGKALTGIIIKVYGRSVAAGPVSMDLARLALIAGATIDDNGNYFNTEDLVEDDVAGGQTKLLTIRTADKIAADGNSFTDNYYTPRGKGYLAKLSMFSDYNFENFSVSGETYQTSLARIRTGALTFGNRSWKDYGVTHALLIHATNDGAYARYSDYLDDIRGTCETVRGTGAIPIVATEFVRGLFSGEFQMGLQTVAEQQGGYFVNLLPNARTYDPTGGRDLELWGSGHPGVRTNELFSAPLERFFNSLPRPRQSLKIFRQRPGVTVTVPHDLMYDTYFDRARLFKEINLGHTAMTAATEKYMDELATNLASTLYEKIDSEYLKLDAGVGVTFTDPYAAIDAILDGTDQTIDEITLVLSDPDITVYIRDVLAAPYENATRYQRFEVTGSPTIVVGDTYTSSDGDLAGTFTVVGKVGNQLIMSPMDAERTKEGAGTLTRTSGTGSASVSYTSSMPGSHPDYYTNLGVPEGHWVAVAGAGGRYRVTDLRGRLQFDRAQFLLYKSGGFTLTDVRIEYEGQGGKPSLPRPSYNLPKLGVEMLGETHCGDVTELSAWTVVGSVTPGAHADDLSDPPVGSVGYSPLTDANRLRQVFTFTADPINDREVLVKVQARRHAALVDGATYPTGAEITADTFDWSLVKVEMIAGTIVAPMHAKVGLWWTDCYWRSMLPAGLTSLTIDVGSTGDVVDVASVSVRPIEGL